MLKVRLFKSTIGHTPRNRATVASLGLRKVNSVAYHEDTSAIRGMIHAVKHLLVVEEVESAPNLTPRPTKSVTGTSANGGAPVAKAPAKTTSKPAAKPAAKATPKAKAASEEKAAPKKRTTKKEDAS